MATTTEYTKDNKSAIVFLNDKCIAQTSNDIENIKYNAIPSLSLFNNEMSTCVKNDLCIGLSVDGISSVVELSVKNAVLSAEQWAISVAHDSKEYIDGGIKTTKDELSNTLSSYTNTKITSLSATTNAEFAKYDDFSFEYDSDRHLIQLTLKNKDGRTVMKSIKSTDFIKNRIIDHIDITDDGKYLRIFWKNSTGADDHIDIELADLVQIYTGKDGIVISQSDTGPYTIAANETIARTSDLTGIAATVKELSTKTINRLDGRIDKLSSDISVIQTYTDELSVRDGIIQTIENRLTDLDTKTDATNTDLETEKSKIVVLQAYADELSNNSDAAPGIIKQLSTEINALRSDVSATVSIAGHITLSRGEKVGDGKLSAIFKKFNLLESGTLRNGNTYSVEFNDIDDKSISDMSSTVIKTTDTPPVYLAHGDYITIHSHTIDPVTPDNLTANIIILPEIKPFQLYSLSGVVYDLSTALSTDISALSDGISADVNRLSTWLSTDISALSDWLSADIKALSTSLSLELSSQISSLSTALSTDISALSDGISADVTQLSNDVKTISAGLTADVDTLSDDISCKIGADGIYLSTLSILHIDDEDYYELVKNNHVNSDTLYIVSGGYNNAYDLQVKYVAGPTDDADATTKKYVDDKCVSADNKIAILSTTVATTIKALKHDLSTFADSATEKNIDVIFNALSSIYSMISAFPF